MSVIQAALRVIVFGQSISPTGNSAPPLNFLSFPIVMVCVLVVLFPYASVAVYVLVIVHSPHSFRKSFLTSVIIAVQLSVADAAPNLVKVVKSS